MWSLSYEFWYYIIFPLLFIAISRLNMPFNKRAAFGVAGVAILLLVVEQEIAIYFIIWLLGMAVVICAPREEQKKSGMAMAALIALSLLLFLLSFDLLRGAF